MKECCLLLFQGDFVVESSRKPKLSAHDKFLKQFEYTTALDSVLQVSKWGSEDGS